ncbi:hypothetical protein BDQ17DRAFT_1411844 [Cyathus striatus]|nr:hypothetical protein BDQ17DRAFT_1411844 [Cyathus striatus]
MSFLFTTPSDSWTKRSDKSFTLPPLDGSLTVPELYDWNYEHNPNGLVFVHSDSPSGLKFSDVVPAIHRAGQYVSGAIGGATVRSDRKDIVAIFSAADTITYATTIFGLLRAGIPLHPISPRFSPIVIAHLIKDAGVSHVLVGDEDALHSIIKSALEILTNWDSKTPKLHRMPTYEELYLPSDPTWTALPENKPDYSSTVLVMHSSGSTAFPKPVAMTPRIMLQNAILPWYGKHDLRGKIFGCQVIELFHIFGMSFLNWIWSSGLVLATFPPKSPAVRPTPQVVFHHYLLTKPDYILAPPVYIREWSRDTEKISFFRNLGGLASEPYIFYGGRALNKETGDSLVKQGVKLHTVYGMTEIGGISVIFSEAFGEDWEYLQISPHSTFKLISNDDGTDTLVFLGGLTQDLTITNMDLDGKRAYAGGDVISKHPTKDGFYKIVGRKDDQIMLSTGETINPIPFGWFLLVPYFLLELKFLLEEALCDSPFITSAVIFGRGRSKPGILITPAYDKFMGKPQSYILELVWGKVKEINSKLPNEGGIPRELILIVPESKPLELSSKGMPKRAACLKLYEAEIEASYEHQSSSALKCLLLRYREIILSRLKRKVKRNCT